MPTASAVGSCDFLTLVYVAILWHDTRCGHRLLMSEATYGIVASCPPVNGGTGADRTIAITGQGAEADDETATGRHSILARRQRRRRGRSAQPLRDNHYASTTASDAS